VALASGPPTNASANAEEVAYVSTSNPFFSPGGAESVKARSLIVVVRLALLWGCGQAAPPANTGIAGRVFISGGPAPGITRPYPASEVKIIDSTGRAVATALPSSDATFSVAVASGNYTVQAVATGGNPWFQPAKVTVRASHYTTVNIYASVR
jgi:hypothetical protein